MVSVATLLVTCKSRHRERMHEWVWLCPHKTLPTKTGVRLDLPQGHELPTPHSVGDN